MANNKMIKTITLPRSMVNTLLHQAQLADKNTVMGLITKKDQKIADHYPIALSTNSSSFQQTLEQIKNNNEHLFAVYSSNGDSEHAAIKQLLAEQDLLQLTISQDIKGVLQLTGLQQQSIPQEIQLLIN